MNVPSGSLNLRDLLSSPTRLNQLVESNQLVELNQLVESDPSPPHQYRCPYPGCICITTTQFQALHHQELAHTIDHSQTALPKQPATPLVMGNVLHLQDLANKVLPVKKPYSLTRTRNNLLPGVPRFDFISSTLFYPSRSSIPLL